MSYFRCIKILGIDVIFQASRMTLVQALIFGSKEQIEAMDSIRTVCDGVDLGGDCFAYSDVFLDYEGNRVCVLK